MGVAVPAAIGLAACGSTSTNSAATLTPAPTPYVATDSGFSAVFPATRIFFGGSKPYVLEGITSSVDVKYPDYDKLLATFKII